MTMPTHDQIANLAYKLWQQRGCPDGSPEVDWERAMRVLEEPPGSDNAIVGFADAAEPAAGAGQTGNRHNTAHRPARPS
jgi:hypothetical protein